MRVWIKQGVMGTLTPIARKGLGRVARFYFEHGEELYITSIMEGTHSAGSLHYAGMAFDFRKGNCFALQAIRLVLGSDWDVVDEGNHCHAEYDPKR